jgi:hypothetical protein
MRVTVLSEGEVLVSPHVARRGATWVTASLWLLGDGPGTRRTGTQT